MKQEYIKVDGRFVINHSIIYNVVNFNGNYRIINKKLYEIYSNNRYREIPHIRFDVLAKEIKYIPISNYLEYFYLLMKLI